MIDALLSQDPVLYLCLALWVLVMLVACSKDVLRFAAAQIEDVAALPRPDDDDTDEEVAA